MATDYDRAVARIRKAQRTFQVGALRQMHPDLQGDELARAVAREASRDAAYARNMQRRLREGFRRINADPTLTPQERREKGRKLVEMERGYLERHIEEAGWRMMREAEMSRLKRLREDGAYWLLDPNRRTHTTDCLAMEGRIWPWSVLERINPANRHPGCGCKLISIREARRRGLNLRRGIRTPHMLAATQMQEASKRQNYRVFIAGRGRHVFGSADPKEVRKWLVTLKRGDNDDYPPHSDWHVERRGEYGWEPISPRSRDLLAAKIAEELGPGYDVLKAGRARHVRVLSYTRRDGTRVKGHFREAKRTRFDGDFVHVPVRPGARGGQTHVRSYTRTVKGKTQQVREHVRSVRVRAFVPAWMEGAVDQYLDAVEAGDVARMESYYSDLVQMGRKIENWDERDDALRSLTRIRQAAMNPEGVRTPMGARVNIGRRRNQAIPRGVQEPDGITDPWGEDGTFRYHVPRGAFGPGTATFIDRLSASNVIDVSETETGWTVRTRPDLSIDVARARARHIEILQPAMNRLRMVSDDEALGIEDPLDIGDDEVDYNWSAKENVESRLRNVPTRQVGDAAESLLYDVAKSLVELDIVPDALDRIEFPSTQNESGNAPLDWELGSFGVEVKGAIMRGFVPHITPESTESIDPKDRASKIAEIMAKELKPAYAHVYVDAETDVAHVFWREYGEDEQPFGDARVPMALRDALIDGTLEPGDFAIPERGPGAGDPTHRTIYVGTFRLRYNPLKLGDVGGITKKELRARAEDPKRGGRADVGVRKKVPPASQVPRKVPKRQESTARMTPEEREARDDLVVDLFLNQGLSQSAIAQRAEVGLSQNGVHYVLKRRLGEQKLKKLAGKGARRDLGKTRKRTIGEDERVDEIRRLYDEADMTPEDIAKRMKTTRGYVRRVLDLDRPQKADEPDQRALDIVQLRDDLGLDWEEITGMVDVADADEAKRLYRLIRGDEVAESAGEPRSSGGMALLGTT